MANVSVFVPHNGCPNQCSFCSQKNITGVVTQPTANDVKSTVKLALESLKSNSHKAEIAFFGGSFTAIDRKYMLELLDSTVEFRNLFKGIRISTRPDAITVEILEILKSYGVTSIELGAQSMSDTVLLANKRGHDKTAVYKACELIKLYGFSLGLQMMTGLYKSSEELDLYTAREFIKLKPDTVRIYPTVVLNNTELAELYKSEKYNPPDAFASVMLCAKLIPMFESAGIKVIRVGLHDSESLRANMLGGGFHPAFGELCRSQIYFEKITNELENVKLSSGKIFISVNKADLSKAIGHKGTNRQKLKTLGYEPVFLEKDTLAQGQVLITKG